jgi:uncharacterized protein YgiB involved in biofilm formation
MLALAGAILRDCEELYDEGLCVHGDNVGDVHGDDGTCVLLTPLVPIFVVGRSARIENGFESEMPFSTGLTSLNAAAWCKPTHYDPSPCTASTHPQRDIAGISRV